MTRVSLEQLTADLVGTLCTKCGIGKLQAGLTSVRFDKIFRSDNEEQEVKVTFEIQEVPVLICSNCGRELIPTHVNNRLWELVNETISSKKFQDLLTTTWELHENTPRERVRRVEVERAYAPSPS